MGRIEFELYGKKLAFDEDLQKYAKIRKAVEAKKLETFFSLIRMHRKKIPAEILVDALQKEVKQYIESIIKEIASYGIYNRVAMDYLVDNEGYIMMNDAISKYAKIESQTADKEEFKANQKISMAEIEAENEVTGLGFSVLSSDLKGAALYAIQSQLAIDKQTKKAQEMLDRAIDEIVDEKHATIESNMQKYYATDLKDDLFVAVWYTYKNILNYYADDLVAAKVLNEQYFEGINKNRAEEILENFNVIDDKKAVLCTALQLCPFCTDAYKLAAQYNLFDENCLKLCKHYYEFDDILKWFQEEIVENGLAQKGYATEWLEQNKVKLQWLCEIGGKSAKEVLDKMYLDLYNTELGDCMEVFDALSEDGVSTLLKNEKKKEMYAKAFRKIPLSRYKENESNQFVPEESLAAAHELSFALYHKDDDGFFVKVCGYQSISKKIAERYFNTETLKHRKVSSANEAIEMALNALQVEFHQNDRESKLQVEREDKIRKDTFEAKQKRDKRIFNLWLLGFLISCVVGVVMAQNASDLDAKNLIVKLYYIGGFPVTYSVVSCLITMCVEWLSNRKTLKEQE